jgi:divalent metal cation (Fe/Co/Zn/Cd) transporter
MPERKTVLIALAANAAIAVVKAIAGLPGVDEVLDLRTMYVGPESLLVAARVDLADNGSDAETIERLADELEDRLRDEVPAVSEVFLDPTPR